MLENNLLIQYHPLDIYESENRLQAIQDCSSFQTIDTQVSVFKFLSKAIPIKCFVSYHPPLERMGRSVGPIKKKIKK